MIFEKCFSNRPVNYLNKLNILNDNQFEFQKKRSTVDANLSYVENIYSLNEKKTCHINVHRFEEGI